jgi:hypothetical protein
MSLILKEYQDRTQNVEAFFLLDFFLMQWNGATEIQIITCYQSTEKTQVAMLCKKPTEESAFITPIYQRIILYEQGRTPRNKTKQNNQYIHQIHHFP